MNELDRLLGAIEQLLDAEAVALLQGNVRTAVAMQARGAPVIRRLIEVLKAKNGLLAAPAHLAERFHVVRVKRRENLDLLVDLKAKHATLRVRLAEARLRLNRVKPAYGQKKVAVPRFSAAG